MPPPKPKPRAPNEVELTLRRAAARPYAALLRRSAREFLAQLGLSGVALSLAVVGDAEIRRLNREWRKKDKATDVLSFPAGEPLPGVPGPRPLGDVILSLDTARRAGREHGRTCAQELRRYLAHGLLHLLGHDHHRRAEAARMAQLERALLGEEGMLGG